MNFSTDRDLLPFEPNVFIDVPLLSQQKIDVTDAVVTGITLTTAAANFTSAQVEPGDVAVVDGRCLEITRRIDANTLEISLLRRRLADAAIPPGDATECHLQIRTFAPQAALVRSVLLRMVGIREGEPDCSLTEDAVVSLGTMAHLEALGTLERIYSAAHALDGDNATTSAKYRQYRDMFNQACRRAVIAIDLDGDGLADTRRSPAHIQLTRT